MRFSPLSWSLGQNPIKPRPSLEYPADFLFRHRRGLQHRLHGCVERPALDHGFLDFLGDVGSISLGHAKFCYVFSTDFPQWRSVLYSRCSSMHLTGIEIRADNLSGPVPKFWSNGVPLQGYDSSVQIRPGPFVMRKVEAGRSQQRTYNPSQSSVRAKGSIPQPSAKRF